MPWVVRGDFRCMSACVCAILHDWAVCACQSAHGQHGGHPTEVIPFLSLSLKTHRSRHRRPIPVRTIGCVLAHCIGFNISGNFSPRRILLDPVCIAPCNEICQSYLQQFRLQSFQLFVSDCLSRHLCTLPVEALFGLGLRGQLCSLRCLRDGFWTFAGKSAVI